MPTNTRTVYLTDENGNALIDAHGNLRTLSFSLVQGYSYRLVERASIVSATYAQVVGYSKETSQTIAGVENASEFDVGDFGIVQYAISDRNNTIGYVTCEVTAVGTDSLTVKGIGISVSGKDGARGADGTDGTTFTPSVDTNGNLSWTNNGGLENPETVNVRGKDGVSVTDATAGTPTEQDGYTVTPVTFAFEQGNSKTVNIQAKNGKDAQQNGIINRTASVDTADENSPDFVENNGDLWVKRFAGYGAINALEANLPSGRESTSAATAPNGKIYVFGGTGGDYLNEIVEFDPVAKTVRTLEVTLPSARADTAAATAPNGKIYVFGGELSITSFLNEIVEFDPVAKTVRTLEVTLPSARADTAAATAPNGKIYVFGGGLNTTFFNQIVEFDPVSQSVTTLKETLPYGRINTSAATAPNDMIYVFGGSDGNYTYDKIVEFDPITKTVRTLEVTMPSVIGYTSAATAPNGKIYVFGGRRSSFLNEIVEFDPVSQSVTTLKETLPSERRSTSAATAPNGNIYVFGGIDRDYLNEIIEFDSAVAQYAYSQAVVLSQEEYVQLKNILNGGL